MQNKSINIISSPSGISSKERSGLLIVSCLCFLIVLIATIQSAKAQGTSGMNSAQQTSISAINQRANYNNPWESQIESGTIMTPMAGGTALGDAPGMPQPEPAQMAMPPRMLPPTPPGIDTIQGTNTGDDIAAQQGARQLQTGNKPINANSQLEVLALELERSRQREQAAKNIVPGNLAVAQVMMTSVANSFGAAVAGNPTGGASGSDGQEGGGGGGGAGGAGGSSNGGAFGSALNAILGMPTPGLINVANEAASSAAPPSLVPFKTIPQAVWMVQQMYKNFSIPFAILLLLPGAVITQVKAQVAANFSIKTEDATSPFEGILRAVIAIFLIPATQLIVSYSIDVGNSMAYSVNPAVSIMPILGWVQQVAYNTLPSNNDNAIVPPKAGGVQTPTAGDGGGPFLGGGMLSSVLGGLGGDSMPGGGLAMGQSDSESAPEEQSSLSSTLETMFNVMMYMFSIGILIMTAFQLAIMCYLFLLGPIAAAFFAWPTVKGKIFRPVFGNWVNAVITVSLWRFYWMVILAIMTNRILNLGENGSMLFNLQWEVAIFTCEIGLLFYVPMNPWQFDPGQAYRAVKFYGENIMQAASKGAGGGGNKGGAGKESGSNEGGKNGGGGKEAGKDNKPETNKQNSAITPAGGSGGLSSTHDTRHAFVTESQGAKAGAAKDGINPPPSGNLVASTNNNPTPTKDGPPSTKDLSRDLASTGQQPSGNNSERGVNNPSQSMNPNLISGIQGPPSQGQANASAASFPGSSSNNSSSRPAGSLQSIDGQKLSSNPSDGKPYSFLSEDNEKDLPPSS